MSSKPPPQAPEAGWQLTQWGRVMDISLSKLSIIGSDNGLSPGRRQAIIWNNAGILVIGHLGTYFSEILIKICTFSFKKMHLKMLSGKWWPFCLNLIVLTQVIPDTKMVWHGWRLLKTLRPGGKWLQFCRWHSRYIFFSGNFCILIFKNEIIWRHFSIAYDVLMQDHRKSGSHQIGVWNFWITLKFSRHLATLLPESKVMWTFWHLIFWVLDSVGWYDELYYQILKQAATCQRTAFAYDIMKSYQW